MAGLGIRAKDENSSTIRLMSSTWRTIVATHCSKISFTTSEQSQDGDRGYVVTLDDITDLVTAQRTSAWAVHHPLDVVDLAHDRGDALLEDLLVGGDHLPVLAPRNGRERTIDVRTTSEQSQDGDRGYVVTLDDITDLVTRRARGSPPRGARRRGRRRSARASARRTGWRW
jgi:hypothetical protein